MPNAAIIDIYAAQSSAAGSRVRAEMGGRRQLGSCPRTLTHGTPGGDAQIDRLIDIMHALKDYGLHAWDPQKGAWLFRVGPAVITAAAFLLKFPTPIICHTKPKADGAPPSHHFQPRQRHRPISAGHIPQTSTTATAEPSTSSPPNKRGLARSRPLADAEAIGKAAAEFKQYAAKPTGAAPVIGGPMPGSIQITGVPGRKPAGANAVLVDDTNARPFFPDASTRTHLGRLARRKDW